MSYVSELRALVGNRPLQLPGTGIVIWKKVEGDEGEILVLLQLRSDHNKYGLIGGGIEIGESYRECARRELYEEAGLKANEDSFELLEVYAGKEHMTTHPNGDVVAHTVVLYGVNYNETIQDSYKVLSSETKSLRWMSLKTIRELLEEAEENFFHNNIPIIRDIVNKFF